MRLIDADALDLDREVELADDWKTAHEIANCVKYAPTVDAVPLDKLCEWLAKFGCPCDINEDMCDQAHGVDRCLGIFNSSAFCWQYLLTKMMEEQDAPN